MPTLASSTVFVAAFEVGHILLLSVTFCSMTKPYRSFLLLMLKHPLDIQSLPVITVLSIVPALGQLLADPSHAVPAGLSIQIGLCIPGPSCLCQLGLILSCMTIQPAQHQCSFLVSIVVTKVSLVQLYSL